MTHAAPTRSTPPRPPVQPDAAAPDPAAALIGYLTARAALHEDPSETNLLTLGGTLDTLWSVTPDAARAQQARTTRLNDTLFQLREDLRGLRAHEQTLSGAALSDWLRRWDEALSDLLTTPPRRVSALPRGAHVTFIHKGRAHTGQIMNTVWDAAEAATITGYLIARPGDEDHPDAWLTVRLRHVTGLSAPSSPAQRGTPVQ